MADVGDRERLLLYWLSDYTAEGITPLGLDERYLSDVEYQQRLKRDSFVAGEKFPPRDAVDRAQTLLDSGYFVAWKYDDQGKQRDVTDLRKHLHMPDEVEFALTGPGEREAERFAQLLNGHEGRRKSFEFAAGYVARETHDFPFIVAVPYWMPNNFDPVPDVITYPESAAVTLRYYEDLDDQIFIDETTGELGEDDDEYDSEVITQDRIAGVAITVRELQLTAQWAEVRTDWRQGPVSFRLSYHRSEGESPDLESDDEDLGQYGADVEAGLSSSVSRTAEIDQVMRADSRKIVASIIQQTA